MERFKEEMRESYERTFTGFDKEKATKQLAVGWTAICLLYAGSLFLILSLLHI